MNTKIQVLQLSVLNGLLNGCDATSNFMTFPSVVTSFLDVGLHQKEVQVVFFVPKSSV